VSPLSLYHLSSSPCVTSAAATSSQTGRFLCHLSCSHISPDWKSACQAQRASAAFGCWRALAAAAADFWLSMSCVRHTLTQQFGWPALLMTSMEHHTHAMFGSHPVPEGRVSTSLLCTALIANLNPCLGPEHPNTRCSPAKDPILLYVRHACSVFCSLE